MLSTGTAVRRNKLVILSRAHSATVSGTSGGSCKALTQELVGEDELYKGDTDQYDVVEA